MPEQAAATSDRHPSGADRIVVDEAGRYHDMLLLWRVSGW
jgi:hypothetical protein